MNTINRWSTMWDRFLLGNIKIIAVVALVIWITMNAISWLVEHTVAAQLAATNSRLDNFQRQAAVIEAQQNKIIDDMLTHLILIKALAAEQSWVREQAPSRSYNRTRTETFTVTAYTLHPDECGKPVGSPGYGVTASGRKLSNADAFKVVAVDNSKIKFGTRMIIHGPDGPIHVVAADTGGAIQGNRLDLFVGETNRKAAFEWGRRTLKVTILD